MLSFMYHKDLNMKRLIVLILLVSTLSTFGQERKHSIGFRGGPTWGFTYDYLQNEHSGFSWLLSFRQKGMQITGLLKFYRPAFERVTDRFWWYFGVGGHVGYNKWKVYYTYDQGPYTFFTEVNRYAPVMGLDGLFGLEFRMDILPICISVELMPYFELFGKDFYKISFFDFGFGIKYAFN